MINHTSGSQAGSNVPGLVARGWCGEVGGLPHAEIDQTWCEAKGGRGASHYFTRQETACIVQEVGASPFLPSDLVLDKDVAVDQVSAG